MINTYFDNEKNKTPKENNLTNPISHTNNIIEKLQLKEDFLQNLTHDLKSPVFSQIQALRLLLDRNKFHYDSFQEEILNQLLASNLYMKDMIQNVLLNFKSQNTKIDIERNENNFKTTLSEAIESVSYFFKEKNQTIKINYGTEVTTALYDDIEIKRVFINILTNASKYGSSESEIFVNISKKRKNLHVEIINSGKQIPDEELKNVFDIYLTTSKKHKTIGTGLGLYICKKIIEAHKGKISAENLSDDKVKFIFSIPIK